MAWKKYLSNEIWQESISFIVSHPIVSILSQHLEGSLEELQTLEVYGGVCFKEAQSDPTKQKVHATNSSLLEGGIPRHTLSKCQKIAHYRGALYRITG